MKKWFLKLNSKSKQYKSFIATSQFQKITINLDHSAALLKKYFIKNKNPLDELDQFVAEGHLLSNFILFQNNDLNHNFIYTDKEIFIHQFFYNTLTQLSELELHSFLLFHTLIHHHFLKELQIELHQTLSTFLEKRKNLLTEDEYNTVYRQSPLEEATTILMSLLFVSLLHYPNYDNLNLIEKKNLKEIFFSNKAKKILNLDKEDYLYLKTTANFDELSENDKKKFKEFTKFSQKNKTPLLDYVEKSIFKKKILFWCLWTISPLLTQDISRLISFIHQSKTIKRVYLDLPKQDDLYPTKDPNSNPNHRQQLDKIKQPFDEAKTEEEIKKIYPPLINDYIKETLPYLKLMERCHYFDIPMIKMGLKESDPNQNAPTLHQDRLVFDLDKDWEQLVNTEMDHLSSINEDEMVIFFYFLKPIYFLSPTILKHPAVETLIHTDSFTGYGPKKCQNALSLYSRYKKTKEASFVLPSLKTKLLENDPIVHFPFPKNDFYYVDESNFNQFSLFNSLLYSTKNNNGQSKMETNPFSPQRKKVFH